MSEPICCRTCEVAMVTERCERGHGATTCWHLCTVCGQRRMTSEPGAYVARDARKAPARAVAIAGPDEDDDEDV